MRLVLCCILHVLVKHVTCASTAGITPICPSHRCFMAPHHGSPVSCDIRISPLPSAHLPRPPGGNGSGNAAKRGERRHANSICAKKVRARAGRKNLKASASARPVMAPSVRHAALNLGAPGVARSHLAGLGLSHMERVLVHGELSREAAWRTIVCLAAASGPFTATTHQGQSKRETA